MNFDPNLLTHASLDICTKCQLRCPECSTSKGIIRGGFVGEGLLSFVNFKRFLDLNRQINTIEISNWGEVFLNPEIIDMMQLAYERGVHLTCGNGANFNMVSDEVLEALVRYRFWYLNLSIDGASEETYAIYRKGGSFSRVVANIRRLNEYKFKYGHEFPKLSWQFIVFGHNEHEIPRVKELCRELGMVFNPKMNYSAFSPIKDPEKVKTATGLKYASRVEYKKLTGIEYKSPCYQCLFSPQINWNGDVLGCCVNKWGGLGNAFKEPLVILLDSLQYRRHVAALLGNIEFSKDSPCINCPNRIKVEQHPLTAEGLERYAAYIPPPLRS